MNRALEWSDGNANFAIEDRRLRVIRREQGDICQYVEIERLIEMPIDVLEHAMHPPLVLDATVAGSHAAPKEV